MQTGAACQKENVTSRQPCEKIFSTQTSKRGFMSMVKVNFAVYGIDYKLSLKAMLRVDISSSGKVNS